jgi:LPXTG-motif cell wall-anchored protein
VLPVTGIHPIRQMGAVGLTMVAIGIWLMVVFRRRTAKR